MDATTRIIEQTFVEHSGRVLAALISKLHDFDLAEDVMQEAFIIALERWRKDGVPKNPGGWITLTARNKAIDRIRRDNNYARKLELLTDLTSATHDDDISVDEIPDERLKLIFTCCHPALSMDAQVALTLRTLGGLSTPEIAKTFLINEKTMAQRIVRAKRKIKQANIPYRVPPTHLIAERLEAVLAVIYLIFNEGYAATGGDTLIRRELCNEAIRLGHVLVGLLINEKQEQSIPEAMGLLALMLLHHARQAARVDSHGNLIVLDEQDRSKWNQDAINEGKNILEKAMAMKLVGPYQVQAAISALHTEAERASETDWQQIASLYSVLYHMTPSSIVKLNHAVAVAMAGNLESGLTLLHEIYDLGDYLPFHAAKADLLRRLGKLQAAAGAYQQAYQLAQNGVERTFFRRQMKALDNDK